MSTGTSPAHENHGIRHRSQQETKQGDRGGIAEFLSETLRLGRMLRAQIELLKSVFGNRQEDTLRRLHPAEGVHIGGVGFVAGIAHGEVDQQTVGNRQ